MKTYESERRELYDWINRVTEEYFAKARQADKEHRTHRDSEANYEYLKAYREYVRKMRELKKKYGME